MIEVKPKKSSIELPHATALKRFFKIGAPRFFKPLVQKEEIR